MEDVVGDFGVTADVEAIPQPSQDTLRPIARADWHEEAKSQGDLGEASPTPQSSPDQTEPQKLTRARRRPHMPIHHVRR